MSRAGDKRRALSEVARAKARHEGCTCWPEIVHRVDESIDVRHDDDCPMANAPSSMHVADANGVHDVSSLVAVAERGTAVFVRQERIALLPDGVAVPGVAAEWAEHLSVSNSGVTTVMLSQSAPPAALMALMLACGGLE